MASDTDLDPAPREAVERHASWAELFFDLAAVAAVAALAHVLVLGEGVAGLGLYAVLFPATWMVWTAYTLYGNVAAGNTHVVRLLVGMFGIGVLAASVPGVAHALLGEGGEHADDLPLRVFAVVYVATRGYAAASWERGQVLLDFPVVQHGLGTLPWLVSVFVPHAWVLPLWTVGVVVDLLLVLVVSGEEMLERYEERVRSVRRRRRGRRPPGPRHGRDQAPALTGVEVDAPHLAERLGLFVIIVLGESVVQVVDVAAEESPDWPLLGAGAASFVLLAGMFGLSVLYGWAGVPHLRAGSLGTRPALALHCAVTGVIATVAVALASVVEHVGEPLPDHDRWLLCGAVAAYFAIGLVASVASRGFHWQATLAWVVAGLLVPLGLGVWGTQVHGAALAAYVGLVVLSHVYGVWRGEARRQPSGS